MIDIVVEVENLVKIYPGGVRAVDNISFKVRKGEIYSLLGPNGAGKTTTMKIITTLLKPTSGMVNVGGYSVIEEPQKVRKIIGYVPQDLSADDELTGLENMMLQARLYGYSKSEARRRSIELLEMVGLKEAADKLVKTYSGGMRRRLELAMGLVNEPEVLILDEPTLGLDVQSRIHIWDYIRRIIRENSITVIMTTHYMEEADSLSDRVAIIDRGKIVVEGTPEELKSRISGEIILIYTENEADKQVMDKISTLKDVIDVDKIDKVIRIKVNSIASTINKILNLIEREKVGVKSISIEKPTLEQVFIEYTGRMFRDEEPVDSRRMIAIWRRRR